MEQLYTGYVASMFQGGNEALTTVEKHADVLIEEWKEKGQVARSSLCFVSSRTNSDGQLNYALLDGDKIIGLVKLDSLRELLVGSHDVEFESILEVTRRFFVDSLVRVFEYKVASSIRIVELTSISNNTNGFTLRWQNAEQCLFLLCPSVLWNSKQHQPPKKLQPAVVETIEDIKPRQLQCQLSSITTKLSAIQNVSAGDVLWTDNSLADAVNILLNKEKIGAGHLARIDDKKALLLI